jgi:hypothetical protein
MDAVVNEKTARSLLATPGWLRISICVLAAVLLLLTIISIYWSRTPDVFWVNESTDDNRIVIGYSTTDTLIRVAETLLDKPGGYLSNDRMPPGVFLDNIPNWEAGVLQQVRDLARVIRNDYSRSQSQSKEDDDVRDAEQAFFIDSRSWIFPASESEYRGAINGFRKYRDRLSDDDDSDAEFYARADNLREWLAQVEKRVGSLTRRLGDSVSATRINENLALDPSAESRVVQPSGRYHRRAHILVRGRRHLLRGPRDGLGPCALLPCSRIRFRQRARRQERLRQRASDHP